MPAPRATMDFFAAQAAAKRHTFLLVVLFALAIAFTVALADAGISLVLTSSGQHAGPVTAELEPGGVWRAQFGDLLGPVTLAVLAVVTLGFAWHAV